MDRIKKVYIDSRYKTSDSISNSDFKFEIKEALDLPEIQYVTSVIYQFLIHGIPKKIIIISFT